MRLNSSDDEKKSDEIGLLAIYDQLTKLCKRQRISHSALGADPVLVHTSHCSTRTSFSLISSGSFSLPIRGSCGEDLMIICSSDTSLSVCFKAHYDMEEHSKGAVGRSVTINNPRIKVD